MNKNLFPRLLENLYGISKAKKRPGKVRALCNIARHNTALLVESHLKTNGLQRRQRIPKGTNTICRTFRVTKLTVKNKRQAYLAITNRLLQRHYFAFYNYLRTERVLEINQEFCACFTDWQKAFDRVKWTKFMQILKQTGIHWDERRLISKLCMDQSDKVRLDQGETRSVKTGKGVLQGCCLPPILFNLHSKYPTNKALEGFGDFKVGGRAIRTVEYADGLVLKAEEETVLQGITERLIETVRCYGMENNVTKSQGNKYLKTTNPITDYDRSETAG